MHLPPLQLDKGASQAGQVPLIVPIEGAVYRNGDQTSWLNDQVMTELASSCLILPVWSGWSIAVNDNSLFY